MPACRPPAHLRRHHCRPTLHLLSLTPFLSPYMTAAADDTKSIASSTHSRASRTPSVPSTITSTIGSFLHALVSPLSPVHDTDHPSTTGPAPSASRPPADLQGKSRSLPQLNKAIPNATPGTSGESATAASSTTDEAALLSSTPLSASLPSVFRSVVSLVSPTLASAQLAPEQPAPAPAPVDHQPAPPAAASVPTTKSAELIELEKALGIYTDDQDTYAIVTGSDSNDDAEDPELDRRKRTATDAQPLHVTLNGRLPTTKHICTTGMADQLRKHFPALARLADAWSLVYSMDQHGISLTTLYDRVRQTVANKVVQPRGFVLVVQDSKGKRFGAYLSDGLRVSAHAFYGTGETFVFTYDDATELIKVYPWTGMNDFFIFGDPQYFAVGASDGKFAIWLDHELERGKSDGTITFDNPTLSSERDFECYELELWGMST
ncbi:TLD-domain-containing protein [Catenaria anguillulae PL171]|uniref:Oxidation resistance protein 1 n=1 Tax=Catenaria anguillulae PL171 TaxID=765915 RepID=A0A1Y2H8Z8_9FUNG|nr:TLD-domain-containing protein [Catenaria anguillulae PL171]